MSIGPGALVRVRNLVSRPELNGRTATVKSRDEKRQRWNCWVDGEEKKLSLREENLQLVTVDVLDDDDDEDIFEPSNSSAAAGKATGDRADRPSASAGPSAGRQSRRAARRSVRKRRDGSGGSGGGRGRQRVGHS